MNLGKKRWSVVGARILLAVVFFVYGALKLTGNQFGLGEGLTHSRLSDTSPLIVTWYFFNLSPLYRDSIAFAQIGTGLLLLFRRTAPIGALCFLVIIVNIVLINFGYNIANDVKILSSVLLAIDCFLIVNYLPRYRMLLDTDDAKPIDRSTQA